MMKTVDNKSKIMEEKRIIVADVETQQKYVLPNLSDAAFFIGCSRENVRKSILRHRTTPVCGRYTVCMYSEEKYHAMSCMGFKDGHLSIIFQQRYEDVFGLGRNKREYMLDISGEEDW